MHEKGRGNVTTHTRQWQQQINIWSNANRSRHSTASTVITSASSVTPTNSLYESHSLWPEIAPPNVVQKRPLGDMDLIPRSLWTSLTCHQCLQTVQESQYFQWLMQWPVKYGRGHITLRPVGKCGQFTDWIKLATLWEPTKRSVLSGLKQAAAI